MLADQLIIILLGLILSAMIVRIFWFSERKRIKIKSRANEIQEAFIRVKNGYNPAVLIFRSGTPIKINFQREETVACSEEVIFPDFNRKVDLIPYQTIPIRLNIDKPGEYNFQCGMGMLHGKIIVQ